MIRCYDCGEQIPEGTIRRKNVTTGAGRRRVSLCANCDARRAATMRKRAQAQLVAWAVVIVIGFLCSCLFLCSLVMSR